MIHDVVDARLHLILGHSHRELWIQDRELRHQATVEHVAHLERVLSIGNHRAGIHLRACSCHRQHTTYGQQLLVGIWLFLLQPELVPVVSIIEHRGRYRLRVVAYAAAAKSKNQIHLVLTGNLHALVQFLQRGIGHHTRVLHDGLACLLQDGHHLIVDTITLHTAAAIVQQHHGTVVLQFVLEEVQRLITKI